MPGPSFLDDWKSFTYWADFSNAPLHSNPHGHIGGTDTCWIYIFPRVPYKVVGASVRPCTVIQKEEVMPDGWWYLLLHIILVVDGVLTTNKLTGFSKA